MKSFITRHQIDSVRPSAVINMAHGRMGDYITDYLTRQNIPLFAPLNAGAEHLRALAAVSRAMRSPQLREHLRQARTTDSIRALFVRDIPATAA